MPPKKAASKQKTQEEEREESLQAVILTDSFEDRFAPFSLERPRCLLPVANVPLIDYTLEFLANSGIKNIFLYSTSHEEQITEYINASRWMSSTTPFPSFIILKCPATSAGDALRDLDKRDLITGDFILVSGDVIANIDLDAAIAAHRTRKAKDKNAIMTMVLREAGRDYRSKPSNRKPFFFIDPSQDRCLHYEEVSSRDRGDRRFHLDDDTLAKPEIDLRGDLIDCHIDICTPDVLGLWTDNFDYKSIRTSFLRGVLQDYELNGKTIHTHILDDGYIARVSSLRAYDAITQDIIDRWTYPFTPDCNLLPDHNYRLAKNKVYTESGVVLARGSSVHARSIVGKDTSVGDKSIITGSVLGRRCQIGKNVRIEGSYIWDDVVISDDCVVIGSVIANEVVVAPGCTIGKGSLLSFRVQIGRGTKIEKVRITDTQDEFSSKTSTDAAIVGHGGVGRLYEQDSDTSQFSDGLLSTLSRRQSTSSLDSISTLHSDIDTDAGGSLTSMPGSPTDSIRGSKIFLTEAITSIQDGILKGDDPDTVKLELLGQRLTHNASDTDMRDAIARALIRSVFTFIKPPQHKPSDDLLSTSPSSTLLGAAGPIQPLQPITAMAAVTKVYTTYSPVLVQLGLFDSAQEAKSDQVAVLREIEKECSTHREVQGSGNSLGQEVLLFALNVLNVKLGVLQDEALMQWWDGGVEGDATAKDEDDGAAAEVKVIPVGMEVRKLAVKFMDLILAEDESSDEEDDDEEEEDDSE